MRGGQRQDFIRGTLYVRIPDHPSSNDESDIPAVVVQPEIAPLRALWYSPACRVHPSPGTWHLGAARHGDSLCI